MFVTILLGGIEMKNTKTDNAVRNKYLYRKLRLDYIESKENINVKKDDFDGLCELRNRVKDYLGKNKGFIENENTGYVAKLTQQTIRKIIYPSPNINKYRKDYIYNLNAALNLCELFQKAIYVDTLPPMKNKKNNVNELGYHHFVAPIILFGNRCRALITVREKIDSKILYIVSIEIISCIASKEKTISLSDLMSNIKLWNYDKKDYEIYSVADLVCSDVTPYGGRLSSPKSFIIE